MSRELQPVAISKSNPCWRKAILFARIYHRLLRRTANARDLRVIRTILQDEGVTNRLIHQGLECLEARKSR